MKRIYWRPHSIPQHVLILIATLSVGGIAAVEHFKVRTQQSYYAEKRSAATLAKRAFDVILAEQTRRNYVIDPESDPAQSGLIGRLLTPVTTNRGSLQSKQTSINPNFAAVLVHLLKRLDIKPDDWVAVGLSGSFPAINICTYAALQTLGAKPIIIASASASQWGANDPEFLWLDMENLLFSKQVFPFRSAAASVGGIEDRGLGLSKYGRQLILDGITRNQIPLIKTKTYDESVLERIRIFEEAAGGGSIKAYINIGGGTTSVGTKVGKRIFQPGINRTAPPGLGEIDSVMFQFVDRGVPVIHLSGFHELADRYGLPRQPTLTPRVGEGSIFVREEYSQLLTLIVLLGLIGSLMVFVRGDLGYRLLVSRRARSQRPPQQMI